MNGLTRRFIFNVDDQKYLFDGNDLRLYCLSTDVINNKVNTSLEREKNDKKNFLRSVALNLTNSCNLCCDYCFADQGDYDVPGAVMSFDIAVKSIDLVLDSVLKHGEDCLSIAFFGGEPLLAFDLIKSIVEYVKKCIPEGIEVQYLMTTNGTLITPVIAEYFRVNNFLVTVSVDGDKKIHDYSRKYPDGSGSHERTIQGLFMLLPYVPLTARITITNSNTDIDKAVDYLLTLGVKRMTYALDYQIDDEGFRKFMMSFDKLFQKYVESIIAGKYFDITNITSPIASIVLKKKKLSHCNAGLSYMSISADGKIYRCPRFTGHKQFSLGTVKKIDLTQIDVAIDRLTLSLGKNVGARVFDCSNCAFVYLCGGMCYHHSYLTNGSEFEINQKECYYRQQLFGKILDLICRMSVAERRSFLLYLNQSWGKGGE